MVAEKAADLIRGREPLAPFWSGERVKGKASQSGSEREPGDSFYSSGECVKGKASKTNENLNAPTIMVAEKAADLIRGREPLASFWSGECVKGKASQRGSGR